MLRCRILDATFGHDLSATAWKTPKHIEWIRADAPANGPNVYVDGFLYAPLLDNPRTHIGWLHEPPELIPNVYAHAADAAASGRFSTVLTYHPELLALPGFTWCGYMGCWIPESDWGLKSKTQLCSMLIGTKLATSGHRLRQAAAAALIARRLPVEFYGSIGTPTDYSIRTKYAVNAAAAFTIVTETQALGGLWTEWLLDCFAVGTVPIYAGAPDAGRWFNAAGILSFSSPAECADIVAGLSFGLYESMLPAVRDNLARVAEYAVFEDWLFDNLLHKYDTGE